MLCLEGPSGLGMVLSVCLEPTARQTQIFDMISVGVVGPGRQGEGEGVGGWQGREGNLLWCLFLSRCLLQPAHIFSLLPVLPVPSRQMGHWGECVVFKRTKISLMPSFYQGV